MDKRIINKVQELVKEGVRNANEMKRFLSFYVEKELFTDEYKPHYTDRKYYPSKQDIMMCMYRAATRLRFSKFDQENLSALVQAWQSSNPSDNFFFRGCYNDNSSSQKFLFVHQNRNMRRLMLRYGNNLSLLDATYRTTLYVVPLFLVVTKTNVDYQPIGVFAMQDEMTSSIQEAISILKSWCPQWSPKVFFVDYCKEEIGAIENIFISKDFVDSYVLNF